MVNFLQQRGNNLYSSHPFLPAENSITAMLDKDAASDENEKTPLLSCDSGSKEILRWAQGKQSAR